MGRFFNFAQNSPLKCEINEFPIGHPDLAEEFVFSFGLAVEAVSCRRFVLRMMWDGRCGA
jgi:hypothetical protein